MKKITFYCLLGALGLNTNTNANAAEVDIHNNVAVCPEKITMQANGNSCSYFSGDNYTPFKKKGNSVLEQGNAYPPHTQYNKEHCKSVPLWGEISWSNSIGMKPKKTTAYVFSYAELTKNSFSCVYSADMGPSLVLRNKEYYIASKSDLVNWKIIGKSNPIQYRCTDSSDECTVTIVPKPKINP